MNPTSPMIDPDVFFPPGSMILTTIEGWTGRWVAAAQAFVRGGSRWTHAAIVIGDGLMVEAQPGGAVVSRIDRLLDRRPILASDDPVRLAVSRAILPELAGAREAYEYRLRRDVVNAARSLVGTPYSFVDYVALAALEANLGVGKVLREYVERSDRLICSALVDRAYSRAGIELFDDGRYAGDVTPGDLDVWIQVARSSYQLPGWDARTDTLRTTMK